MNCYSHITAIYCRYCAKMLFFSYFFACRIEIFSFLLSTWYQCCFLYVANIFTTCLYLSIAYSISLQPVLFWCRCNTGKSFINQCKKKTLECLSAPYQNQRWMNGNMPVCLNNFIFVCIVYLGFNVCFLKANQIFCECNIYIFPLQPIPDAPS